MEAVLILIVIIVVAGLFLMNVYNGLIRLKLKVEEAWSGIDTQLKKRYDLIPNIVETVKGYASHEKSVFENVTKARSMAMQATDPKSQAEAENMLSGTLKSLFAVAENYPDLKANENFLNLQHTLKDVEEHINKSRMYYNATVKDYNTKKQIFPNNFIVGFFAASFPDKEFFEIEEAERENVKVSFSDNNSDTNQENSSSANK